MDFLKFEPSIPVAAGRPRGAWMGTSEVRQGLERGDAGVDLGAPEAADPIGAEVLDVEGGHGRAHHHRLAKLGVAGLVGAEAVEEAEEAAGEAVSRPGRVADLGQGEGGHREGVVAGEQGGAVLAALDDHDPRARFHDPVGGDDQVGFAGQHPQLGVVEQQAVDLADHVHQGVAGGVDPEVHRVESDEPGAGRLRSHLPLQVRLDVAEEEHLRRARLLAQLRDEVGEDVELGVVGVGDVHVVVVVAAPEEGPAAGHLLDPEGGDPVLLEHAELRGPEIVADRADDADVGEEAGREREMAGGAPEHALALAERGAHGVEGDRSDNGQGHGRGTLSATKPSSSI